jgi:CRP-like cAMP-binding protein
MTLDDQIALFSQIPLFEGFDTQHLRLLAFGAEERKLIKGSKLFTHGMYSDGGYIIADGRVDLLHENGIEIFGSYSAGALIGELALISDSTRFGTAVAKSEVLTFKISRALFHKMLSEYPQIANLLQNRLAKNLQEFLDQVEKIHNKYV